MEPGEAAASGDHEAIASEDDGGECEEREEDEVLRDVDEDSGAEGAEDDAADYDEDSSMEDSSMESLLPDVLNLHCVDCSQLLCTRGMEVILVSDASKKLFSTDFWPVCVTESSVEHQHECCKCCIRDVACGHCSRVVGYHVIQPCESCSKHGHNEHYWLMWGDNVRAEPRHGADGQPLKWTTDAGLGGYTHPVDSSDMPKASSPQESVPEAAAASETAVLSAQECAGSPAAILSSPQLPLKDDESCVICHESMHAPHALPCGHEACLRCLTRAVDLRRACPCCRRPTSCSELRPVHPVSPVKLGAPLGSA
eukprot:TRINITY_DN76795_c0_g1_i1.p1 TRINITY_DN76795_c0_g1~~TRINITY_DN76795_c0_g1_i1.p1  ORF type:complete len:311 (+),score=59.76 TRINITY_DN76795_c0_g1_i1:67-999(+)